MSSPLIRGGRGAASAAFTLIELLTVIAIIGVLAAITFGVTKGVQERAAISQARVELAAIASALENYKRQYGDYPRVETTDTNILEVKVPATPLTTDRAYHLVRALMGRTGPTRATLTRENPPGTFTNKYGKTFLERGNFTFERSASTDNPTGNNPFPQPAASGADPDFVNALVDPWGNRYVYLYRQVSGGTWTNSSFLLMSGGPDGHIKWPSAAVLASGQLTETFYTDVESSGANAGKGNSDNLYHNR